MHDGKEHILYDADEAIHADSALFEPAAWRRFEPLGGARGGRGEAFILDDGAREFVLRHYRRGGLPGRLIRDRYLWTGLERSRAWREWRLTAELFRRGLPVPQPIAARVVRAGFGYRADLLTLRIPNARTLAQSLIDRALPEARWRALGATIRRFHEAGLRHADLNAHNILLDEEKIYLIDFDRSRLHPPARQSEQGARRWQQANLARLERSLHKIRRAHPAMHFSDENGRALLTGYRGG